MIARLTFKTLGISGVFVGLFWASGGIREPLEFLLACACITFSVMTLIIADSEL